MVPKMKGVDVDIELLIQKVSEISEIASSSKMDILFSQIWHDPGLDFRVYIEELNKCYILYLRTPLSLYSVMRIKAPQFFLLGLVEFI
jgi:hypothetical protein